MKKLALLVVLGVAFCVSASALTTNEIDAAHAQIKARYLQYLKGTTNTFTGTLGTQVASSFVSMVNSYVNQARAFDFTQNTNAVFHLSPGDAGYEAEFSVYDSFLTKWLPAMAYAYTVNASGNTNYLRADIRDLYLKSLGYLNGRGVKSGMTFFDDTNNVPKNPPLAGCANVANEELNMGSYCQSVLLMEEAVSNDARFVAARDLVRFMEMLGYSSGLTTYWIPAVNPPAFSNLVSSDAIQVYSDVTLVSAMLETNTVRKGELLSKAQAVYNDSLKVIPGWADTIKPDFTGYHHNCIYGNMYTSGFMVKAAFAVYVLQGTPYFIEDASIENLKNLMLTYRLYAQKYDIPHGIRGRWPQNSGTIKGDPFGAYVTFASTNGIGDADMLPVFDRLWDSTEVGTDFIFDGGRGKILQGLYETDMLKQLTSRTLTPEPDPAGFWYKPYGGLAIHRRDNWMAAVKGHSTYIWDHESGTGENEYGQYLSHGMLTIFAGGSPVSDLDSGYDVEDGWDWYRMPGTTGVHFPLVARQTIQHRMFPVEPFLGGVSVDGQNGLFGMILSDTNFPGTNTTGGITINLKARKSVFLMDNLIVLLGTGISGGDGTNKVETTVFQTCRTSTSQKMLTNGVAFSDGFRSVTTHTNLTLRDPLGLNGYYIRDAYGLNLYQGGQGSFREGGSIVSTGIYSTVWFDHGLSPTGATYEIAVTVTNAATALAASPDSYYQVQRMDTNVHQVYFPQKSQTGYAFFNAVTNNALVAGVDDPCLVMTAATNDSLTVSVVNPDLARVAATQQVTMSFAGNVTNAFLDSQPQPVVITLQGYWQLDSPAGGVEVLSVINNKTTVRFACQGGVALTAVFITYDTTGFTTPGISTWTCPTNVISVQVECWGGGGAGGSAKCTSGSTAQYGGGGAGGAYARYNSYPVVPGNTYYINVGAGGVNSSTNNDATVSGGDSWFNSTTNPSSIIIAKGGAGGQSSIGSTTGTAYGPGGTGTTSGCAGDVVYKGGNGFTAVSLKAGGGGSSGGTATNGTSATNQVGATAPAGGGNGGTGPTTSSANGGNGYSPGGGGGGARAATTTLRSGGTGSVGRVVLSYTAIVPPDIAEQPSNQVVTVGDTAAFTVGATGNPLAYRWRFNATNLLAATNSTLVITNVQLSQAGDYTVVVTNAFGSVTSAVATLTVNAQMPPSITNQPTNQLVTVGHTATFTVGAAGSGPLFYRWRFNATNDLSATNSTLVVDNVQFSHAGSYTVVVTNTFGTVTSAVAVLTVDAAGLTAVNFDDTWNADSNGGGVTGTLVSATSGTNAAVSFNLGTGTNSYMAGGYYNSFSATALGSAAGDSITLKFTTTFTGGTLTNLNLKFSFGLAGANDKVYTLLDPWVAATPKFNLGAYVDEPNNAAGAALYRGDVGASATNPATSTYTGSFTNGPDATAATYTLSLTRTATGADLVVSGADAEGNNWTSTTRTLTTAQVDAITLDKIFIGINGSNGGGTFVYTITNLSLTVNSAPAFHTLTVNGGTGDGSYTNGQQVAISANAPASGKAFDKWTGDTQYVASVSSASTTVTMPAQAVALTATYKDVYHTLTASGGAGGAVSPASTNVLAGSSATFVITAGNYCRIVTLTTNGTAVTGLTFNNTSMTTNFIWSNVQTSGVLVATFTNQVTTNAPADVPYSWLAGYGLTNSGAAFDQAAAADQDGDGLTAWQEYIAGTDPTNTTSCFKAAQAARNVITWSAISGRVYSVYWSTNLVEGFTALHTNILYPTNSFTGATPDSRVNHYQIKVRLQ